MTTTVKVPIGGGDDNVITIDSPCCGGIHSAQVAVREITNRGNQHIELSAPNVRIVLTPSAADKVRLWLNRWSNESAGIW
jgi:hypothetical protein